MRPPLMSATTLCVLWHTLSSAFTHVQGTPGDNYTLVTCNFSIDTCGWTNVGGQYTLTWRRDTTHARMYLEMNGNAKGRLASPWLDPLEDYQCSLKFDFTVNKWWHQSCQLALIRQTASGEEKNLRVFDYDTGFGNAADTETQGIDCTGERFRIVFEGWKSCSDMLVDDIEFTLRYTGTPLPTGITSTAGTTSTTSTDDTENPQTSSSPHATSSTSPYVTSSTSHHVTSATSPNVTSTTSSHITPSTNEEGSSTDPAQGESDASSSGLDSASLAGIIIAVILALVVAVVVMLIIRRRRRQDKPNVDLDSQTGSLAVVNSMYCDTSFERRMEGNHRGNRRNQPADPAEGLELAPLPPPSANSNSHHHHQKASTPHPSLPPPVVATTTSPFSFQDTDTYENLAAPPRATQISGDNKGTSHPTSKPVVSSSVATSDDTYDHISRASLRTVPDNTYDHTNRAPLRSALDDTYNHTNNGAPLGLVSDDTYDHTHRQPLPSVSENPYNHTNEGQPPSASTSSGNDNYNHLHLNRSPAVNTSSENTYGNIPQHPQPASDVYAQPHVRKGVQHNQGNAKNPPITTTTTTTTPSSSPIVAPLGTSDYKNVPGDVGQNVKSSAEEGDVYNRLDVTGEGRRREEGVGENVYDHAKDDDYDSLHEENKRRRQQRQLARDDYSHL